MGVNGIDRIEISNVTVAGWYITAYNEYQAITGKNNQMKVVELGSMNFDDAIALVEPELQLAA